MPFRQLSVDIGDCTYQIRSKPVNFGQAVGTALLPHPGDSGERQHSWWVRRHDRQVEETTRWQTMTERDDRWWTGDRPGSRWNWRNSPFRWPVTAIESLPAKPPDNLRMTGQNLRMTGQNLRMTGLMFSISYRSMYKRPRSGMECMYGCVSV